MKIVYVLWLVFLPTIAGLSETTNSEIHLETTEGEGEPSPTVGDGIAFTRNNPFSLKDYKTGKYRVFSTPEEGVTAGIKQIELYVSGKSAHTDSTTTIEQGLIKYIGHSRGYHREAIKQLGIDRTTKLHKVSSKELALVILYYENVKFYNKYIKK